LPFGCCIARRRCWNLAQHKIALLHSCVP
jgi:hypothetical protein